MTTTKFPRLQGPKGARILVVSDTPTDQEFRGCEQSNFTPGHMIGAAGDIWQDMCLAAGLQCEDMMYTTLFPAPAKDTARSQNDVAAKYMLPNKLKRAPDRFGLTPRDNQWQEAVEYLHKLVLAMEPEFIIVLGSWSMLALHPRACSISLDKGYREPKAGKWRGSMEWMERVDAPPIPLIHTWHPDLVRRQWSLRPDVIRDLQRIADNPSGWPEINYDFIIRPDLSTVMAFLQEIEDDLNHPSRIRIPISVDLETRAGHIACVGLASSNYRALCIPFICNERDHYWSLEAEFKIIRALRRILTHPSAYIIGQNFLYDAQYIAAEWLIRLPPDFDTLVLSHLCWPSRPRGLDYLSATYARVHVYWKDEGKHFEDTHLENEDEYWTYNCKDAVITFEVSFAIQATIHRLGLRQQQDFQMRTVRCTLDFMLRGVLVDKARRAQVLMDLQRTIAEYAQWFDSIITEQLWPIERHGPRSKYAGQPKKARWWDSQHQQKEIFYDELGIQEVKDRKSKSGRSMSDAALETLKVREPLLRIVFQRLQEYRSLGVFGNMLSAKVDPDGRMRSSFDPAGTETFRFSSSKNAWDRGMNMQNIPAGLDEEDVVT